MTHNNKQSMMSSNKQNNSSYTMDEQYREYTNMNQRRNNSKEKTTTLMLRNIPNKYNQRELIEDLTKMGYRPIREVDFFYLPMDSTTGNNKGYAFINFLCPNVAAQFRNHMYDHTLPRYLTKKTLEVMEAKFQGIRGLWCCYQRSSVMYHNNKTFRPMFWPMKACADGMRTYTLADADLPGIPGMDDDDVRKNKKRVVDEEEEEEDDMVEEDWRECTKGDDEANKNEPVTWRSTFMLQNIRKKYDQPVVMDILQELGIIPGEDYDFIYLPIDSDKQKNQCFAFINFCHPSAVEKLRRLGRDELPIFFQARVLSAKECIKEAALQGYAANLQYYLRSTVIRSGDPRHRPMFWPKSGCKVAWEPEDLGPFGEISNINKIPMPKGGMRALAKIECPSPRGQQQQQSVFSQFSQHITQGNTQQVFNASFTRQNSKLEAPRTMERSIPSISLTPMEDNQEYSEAGEMRKSSVDLKALYQKERLGGGSKLATQSTVASLTPSACMSAIGPYQTRDSSCMFENEVVGEGEYNIEHAGDEYFLGPEDFEAYEEDSEGEEFYFANRGGFYPRGRVIESGVFTPFPHTTAMDMDDFGVDSSDEVEMEDVKTVAWDNASMVSGMVMTLENEVPVVTQPVRYGSILSTNQTIQGRENSGYEHVPHFHQDFHQDYQPSLALAFPRQQSNFTLNLSSILF